MVGYHHPSRTVLMVLLASQPRQCWSNSEFLMVNKAIVLDSKWLRTPGRILLAVILFGLFHSLMRHAVLQNNLLRVVSQLKPRGVFPGRDFLELFLFTSGNQNSYSPYSKDMFNQWSKKNLSLVLTDVQIKVNHQKTA